MKTLDFIASLEHGEAKAAALTVYNLMQPKPKPVGSELKATSSSSSSEDKVEAVRHWRRSWHRVATYLGA